MQFHEKEYFDLTDFMSFFAWTFLNFLACRCEVTTTYFGQMTFAQGLFDGQFLCKFLAIVA